MITVGNRIVVIRTTLASSLCCTLFAFLSPAACQADSGGGIGGANPGVPAIATSSVTYDVTSLDWAMQSQDISDNGGNYSAIGEGYLQALVSSSVPGQISQDWEQMVTTFAYTGAGAATTCNYTSNGEVTATIGENGQTAYATECILGPGLVHQNEIEVDSINVPPGIEAYQVSSVSPSIPNNGSTYTVTETTLLWVYANTP